MRKIADKIIMRGTLPYGNYMMHSDYSKSNLKKNSV